MVCLRKKVEIIRLDCTVVILTYKGKKHLEELLPTLEIALKRVTSFSVEVLIVDNSSEQATKEWVEQYFPDFRYEFSENNYLYSLNKFIKKLNSKCFFLLNDDMKLHHDVIENGLKTFFADDNLFAVSCRLRSFHDEKDTLAIRTFQVENGWPRIIDLENKYEKTYTMYAGGGASFYATKVFNELDGFTDLYQPAYSEDSDISLRAWFAGYKIIQDNTAILYHKVGGTINTQKTANKWHVIIMRNKLLMFFRNLSDNKFKTFFIAKIPYWLIVNAFNHKVTFKALLSMIKYLPRAWELRSVNKKVRESDFISLLGTKYDS